MTDWEQLCAAAVLGTARQPQARPAVAGLPPSWIDAAPGAEQALLRAAAALSLLRQAGAETPRPALTPPPPADPEPWPPAGPHAAAQLAQICREDHAQDLLAEWLHEARQRQRRAPESLLPALLVRGQRDSGLRPALASVLGARGAWLAQLNPNWQYLLAAAAPAVAPEDAAARWSLATAAERQGLLRSLRASQPAQARELLASTWKADNADTRGRLLELLATGLTAADEGFLESVLDERSQEVRQRAVDLLLALPESALRRRAQERALPLLQSSRGLLRTRVELQLPAAWDEAWKRDGIRKDLPAQRKDLGERGWWALQLLAMLPPSHWCAHWNCEPAQLIARSEGDWQALLLEAWFLAARRCGDRDWLGAYLEYLAADGKRASVDHVSACAEALDEHALQQCTVRALQRRASADIAMQLLPICAARSALRHWPASLAQAYVEALVQAVRQADYEFAEFFRHHFSACALRLPPPLSQELLRQLTALPTPEIAGDYRKQAVERSRQHIIQYLERRGALLRAFTLDQGETT